MHAQGEKAGDTVAPDAPAPAQPTASKPPARASRFTWVRAKADAVPTKWLSTIALGAFLIGTAAFGGLNEVEAEALPELAAGETYTGAGLEITVLGASLVDEDLSTGVHTLDRPDMRILTVYLDVTNLDVETRTVDSDGTLKDFDFPEALDAVTDPLGLEVRRTDDRAPDTPQLHPGVTAPLMISWMVPKDEYVEGDTIRIGLPTATKVAGQTVIASDYLYWSDIGVGAHVTIPIEDLGRGTRSEEPE